MPMENKYASDEQRAYASWLNIGMRSGFVLLLGTFAAYVSGLLPPHVSLEDLPRYWNLPVAEYLQATGTGRGWSWLAHVGKGDYLNLAGIALLSSITIACYLRILPMTIARGDRVYAVIVVLEVAVLALAASGLLVMGH
jgi:hypothetical protein